MKYTFQEWQAEGKRRFGENFLDWKFVCPACGRINTGLEFKEAGAKPNDMYSTCIGRHNGNMRPANKGAKEDGKGCDWAAFGLLGTFGSGDVVVSEDGKETDVFPFADAQPEIVMVKFRSKTNKEEFAGREYGYYTAIPVKVGDVVVVPMKNGEAKAQITRVNIKDSEISFDKSLLKTITSMATEQEVSE